MTQRHQMAHSIRRRHGTFVIFTRAEADAAGVTYVPWREARPGQWALTDDAHVAECLSRKTYTDTRGTTRDLVVLSFGRAWVPRKKEFCFKPFHESGHYGGTAPRSWVEREARTERTRRAVRAYVGMSLSPGGVDWDRLGKIYRPDQKHPAKTVKKLFRQPQIQAMVLEAMKQAFSGGRITEEELIQHYRDLLEAAKGQKDLRLWKDILDRFSEWLGRSVAP